MSRQAILLTLCFCILFASASCLNILFALPVAGSGHFLPAKNLVNSLADKNHNVTFISAMNPKDSPNIRHIKIDVPGGLRELFHFGSNVTNFNGALGVKDYIDYAEVTCKTILLSNPIRKLFEEKGFYDLVIIEAFHTNCFFPFAKRYNAPLVLFTTSMLPPWYYSNVAQPFNPAYIPSMVSGLSSRMNFAERVLNTLVHYTQIGIMRCVGKSRDQQYVKDFFEYTGDLDEILQNTSLHLVNSHFTLHGPVPNVPQVVNVGGIHITKPKSLPKNIENWINESEHGVIYFSMGSMIKGHTFPEDKRKIFLRAFGRLKQRVLWKWENDTMPGKPDNVMIQKWMPQFDILCHPNVKAFISHGGLLGTTEAVHCGVPVVVMPQFGDQHTNAKALEAGNGGVILNFREADEEAVYKALTTVLDPEFNKKAKELSARFRDRPMSPMDTAIYWIEYVARHKGAHHMRTAAVGMPLYQYLLLDVFAFLALVAIVALLVVFYTLKFLLSFLKSFFVPQKKLKSQ